MLRECLEMLFRRIRRRHQSRRVPWRRSSRTLAARDSEVDAHDVDDHQAGEVYDDDGNCDKGVLH